MKWDKAGRFSATEFADALDRAVPDTAWAIDGAEQPVVFVVDDDYFSRSGVKRMLEDAQWRVEDFADCETFLAAYRLRPPSCLVLDVHFPGMGGIELMSKMRDAKPLPTIVVSGSSGVSEAVTSMKAGATDFIEKPIASETLVNCVRAALALSRRMNAVSDLRAVARAHLADLTARQRQIMVLMLAGRASKTIAYELGISQRTVENHRAAIMRKSGATSLPALDRLVIAASTHDHLGAARV
jgi:two-component system CheB/CheR fusion protein